MSKSLLDTFNESFNINSNKKFFESNSKFKFDNKELVQYSHELFGNGMGVIVGYYNCSVNGHMYVIYPKRLLVNDNYPFFCFLCKESDLISVPF